VRGSSAAPSCVCKKKIFKFKIGTKHKGKGTLQTNWDKVGNEKETGNNDTPKMSFRFG
jgi:hypothetical protein